MHAGKDFYTRHPVLSICVMAMALLATKSYAAKPETGFYIDVVRPGIGVALEVQGDKLGVVIYAYASDGRPEFYVAGGDLIRGTSQNTGRVVHRFAGELYLPRNGFLLATRDEPPFFALPADFENLEVGRLFLEFEDPAQGRLSVLFNADSPTSPGRSVEKVLLRLPFGVGSTGTGAFAAPNGCWFDLKGTWVFTSTGEPQQGLPVFVNLELVSDEPSTQHRCDDPRRILEYRDKAGQGDLRCVVSLNPADFEGGVVRTEGCQWTPTTSEQGRFWFPLIAIGASSIEGSLGVLPLRNSPPSASTGVRGFRVH